jgi:hypothetical protein
MMRCIYASRTPTCHEPLWFLLKNRRIEPVILGACTSLGDRLDPPFVVSHYFWKSPQLSPKAHECAFHEKHPFFRVGDAEGVYKLF